MKTNTKMANITGIGTVSFERSRRAKHIIISIRPFGNVRVAIPERTSFKKAEQFVRSKIQWIDKHLSRTRQYERTAGVISEVPQKDIIRARQILTARLKQLADRHGFTYNKVSIRQQRSRWGSCSQKNNISLNARLIKLPPELMDYVLLHELIHTRRKDHSRAFWEELDKYVANARDKASKLRRYGLGVM